MRALQVPPFGSDIGARRRRAAALAMGVKALVAVILVAGLLL